MSETSSRIGTEYYLETLIYNPRTADPTRIVTTDRQTEESRWKNRTVSYYGGKLED
jgi:hypothetical protein